LVIVAIAYSSSFMMLFRFTFSCINLNLVCVEVSAVADVLGSGEATIREELCVVNIDRVASSIVIINQIRIDIHTIAAVTICSAISEKRS